MLNGLWHTSVFLGDRGKNDMKVIGTSQNWCQAPKHLHRRPTMDSVPTSCSAHEEKHAPYCQEPLRQGDERTSLLSRRASLVGGALLTATVAGASADVRRAEAADEPAITRKVGRTVMLRTGLRAQDMSLIGFFDSQN
jgi:hypothetical protein